MKTRFLAVLAACSAATMAQATTWTVDPDASSLTITATQTEERFTGAFETFAAEITLDPADLSDAAIRVTIDMASFDSGSGDRDSTVPETAWFDLDTHPEAVFESTSITATGDGSYVATGPLTIKGIARDIELPFTLAIDGQTAVADGEVTINRLDHDVGVGDWADAAFIGHEVKISVHIEAQAAD